jgi:hypothetical protein
MGLFWVVAPCARDLLEVKEQVSQGRALAKPMGKEVRIRQGPGSQEEKRGHVSLASRERIARENKSADI